jgi:6-phosphogluconolactonase
MRFQLMNKQLFLCRNAQVIAQEAARHIIASARKAADMGKEFSLVLSGGSTPQILYEELASSEADINWVRVHLFWGDERCVPPDHKDSNYRTAFESFISHVSIPADHIHRIKGEVDPEKAAEEYEQEIRRHFAENSGFDLVLLGMGDDGHTASLFPHTGALFAENRLVVSNYVEKLASSRITLTSVAINRSACVIFLVSGEGKADVLAQVLEGEYQPEVFPSQLINPPDGNLIWLFDTAAAGNLKCARDKFSHSDQIPVIQITL